MNANDEEHKRIVAEHEALVGSMLGILLTVKDVLRRCNVPVDAEPEPNAGHYAETD